MIFLDKQARRDKQLLRLEREYRRLSRAHWSAPLIPLEHSYQRGWIKRFALREDFLRRQDAYVFRRILDAVNVRLYCRNRSFVQKNAELLILRPKIIPAREWPKLGWPENHKKHFLFGHWREGKGRAARTTLGYKLAHEWILVERIEPAIVTHVRADLPEVRARMTEIESYFQRTMGRFRLHRLHGYSSRRWLALDWSPEELRLQATDTKDCEEVFEAH